MISSLKISNTIFLIYRTEMKKSYYVPLNAILFPTIYYPFFCNPFNEYNSWATSLWYVIQNTFYMLFFWHVCWCVWIRNNFSSNYFYKINQELSFVLKQPISKTGKYKDCTPRRPIKDTELRQEEGRGKRVTKGNLGGG